VGVVPASVVASAPAMATEEDMMRVCVGWDGADGGGGGGGGGALTAMGAAASCVIRRMLRCDGCKGGMDADVRLQGQGKEGHIDQTLPRYQDEEQSKNSKQQHRKINEDGGWVLPFCVETKAHQMD
jgi:hypothetical protein